MKKAALLLFVLLGIVFTIQPVNATTVPILLDGQYLQSDVAPTVESGRTLVPVRVITQQLGGTVDWNSATRQVTLTKDDITILLTLDDTTAIVNGREVQLDVPARAVNGRTLVPLRFVGETFGLFVTYYKQTVLLATDMDDARQMCYDVADGAILVASPVQHNRFATLFFCGEPLTEYSITVLYNSGPSTAQGLESQMTDEIGQALWTWRIGSRTAFGTYRIQITGGGRTFTVPFTVTEEPVE